MGLAEDIANHVYGFMQDAAADTSGLIKAFNGKSFAGFDPHGLKAVLQRSKQFQIDLAQAIEWKQPEEDCGLLASLAFTKALDRSDEFNPRLFAQKFDWESFRANPDLETIMKAFRKSVESRTKFAWDAGAYPGEQNLDRVIASAVDLMEQPGHAGGIVREVLKRHLLNWDEFQAKRQQAQFLDALEEEFAFRQAVAEATAFESGEAKELACLACDMLRTVPAKRRIGSNRREKVIEKLKKNAMTRSLGEAMTGLQHCASPDDWQKVQGRLTTAFSRSPQLATVLWKEMNWPYPFALVLREELKQIAERRAPGSSIPTAVDVSDLAAQMELTGVAFSGGGIRSATFNLGVLQKLAEFGLLEKVDYLSTVSGGGYIGGWLAGWIHRAGISRVKQGLSPKATPDPRSSLRDPIQFLREYSNYLTPTLGLFSFDTWTMIAVYTRNVSLNQATLFALLGTLLLAPRFLALPMSPIAPAGNLWMMWLTLGALLVAVTCMSFNMQHATAMADVDGPSQAHVDKRRRDPLDGFYGTAWVQISVVMCMLVAVTFGSMWFWRNLGSNGELDGKWWKWLAGVFFFVLSALLAVRGGFWNYAGRRFKPEWRLVYKLILTPCLAALCGGMSFGLLLLYLKVMQGWKNLGLQGAWHAEVWGPVLLFTVLVVPGILQVGLMGADFPDSGREWMSRYRAVCTIYVIYWIALLSASIYGPLLVFWAVPHTKTWISAAGAWAGTTVASFLAGSSKKTGKGKDEKPIISWLDVVAMVGPPVFIVGLLIVIATLEQIFLAHFGRGFPLKAMVDLHGYWRALNPRPLCTGKNWWLLGSLGGLVGGGLILAWRVDINEFSMHHFYKNRLVRCYLGASHAQRKCNPFTGFDETDDFPLSRLKAAKPGKGAPYQGPYPIINATLNLSAGKQLAWQERKAASFVFTPCFCGFDYPHTAAEVPHPDLTKKKEEIKDCAYRPTLGYSQPQGPRLGTAVSISGAAANPNQGYNTSAAVAFLMTMFDVRLGWWMGNPRRESESILSGPRFGLGALISELLGRTDDEAKFVNLSDGGHFDNMGIYELVRRRCKFIVLCDAEQDAAYKFGGLGMAIRKCRVDFGATITIDPSRIAPKHGKSQSHCAVGTIDYLDGSRGTLVYIKASVTGDEPEDVIEYHANQPHFPHESTADQWFDESQFESYRALGYHAADSTLSPSELWRPWAPQMGSVQKLFEGLRDYWYPVNPNIREGATRLGERLADLLQTIQNTPELQELGAELFPKSGIVSTAKPNRVAEFYFCMSVLQLVEDVYFELELDREQWFSDPRIGGWRTLFKTWKKVPAMASVWAAQRSTFREDFQQFWMKRIE